MAKCNAISKRSKAHYKNWAIRGTSKSRFHVGKSKGAKKRHKEVIGLIEESKFILSVLRRTNRKNQN